MKGSEIDAKIYDKQKMENINLETLKLFQKYQIDMSVRDLSQNSINAYNADLKQWFIFMYDNQFNLSVLEATEDDIVEYYYWRKQQGNNVNLYETSYGFCLRIL